MAKLLWTPDEQRIENANITNYITYVNKNYELSISDYQELYQWSINNIEEFWESIWVYCNIIHSNSYTKVVENLQTFPPDTKWFLGAKLNYAENLLRYEDDHTAILYKLETHETVSLSYRELYSKVAELAAGLKELGVEPGDRVAAYMPHSIDIVVAMLASTSIGAVWSSCGSELGHQAAIDRLGQVSPKILFTCDQYQYKGQVYEQWSKSKEVVSNVSSIQHIIGFPYIEENFMFDDHPKGLVYSKVIKPSVETIDFAQRSFSDPLYIMFSSGTTGKPKSMVQSIGGVLINHLKELVLHSDLKRDDKLFYLSSPSWMMWNWSVSQLAVGSTLVIYDGNPLYPDWKNIWNFISEEKITVFGCSASYLHHLKTIDAQPGKEFDLSSLKQISQTGSALSKEGFEYVYDEIKSDLHFNSISGGTDINGCFAAGSPTLPVYAGQLQSLALGMKVKSYDRDAQEIEDQEGELVCEVPSPSMPLYFWEDEGDERYQEAYFDYFDEKHVWRHGDYVKIDSVTGGITFLGRSDAVLKPSGVRIGTAEIYNVVEELEEVIDSLAIGQDWENDQRILLFVNLIDELELTTDLKSKIRSELRTKASPRHVPSHIIQVPDIPYTFSGKKVESAVTNILHNKKVTNRGALSNPESLDFYEKMAENLQNE